MNRTPVQGATVPQTLHAGAKHMLCELSYQLGQGWRTYCRYKCVCRGLNGRGHVDRGRLSEQRTSTGCRRHERWYRLLKGGEHGLELTLPAGLGPSGSHFGLGPVSIRESGVPRHWSHNYA